MVWFLWTAQIVIALIFFQTLFFKFTGSPESIYIFSKIGLEPIGRYLVGAAELLAGVLLLIPSTAVYGAILSGLIVIPAIIFHLTSLGIVVQGDRGLLFGMAVLVLVLSIVVVYLRRNQLPFH